VAMDSKPEVRRAAAAGAIRRASAADDTDPKAPTSERSAAAS